MKTKWYEVTVTATKTICIEIEDTGSEDKNISEAEEFSMSEAFSFCQNVESNDCCELETKQQIETSKRHCDEKYLLS